MRTVDTEKTEVRAAADAEHPLPARQIPDHRYRIRSGLAARIAWRGLRNILASRPILLPFEVTRSCNCDCRHCQLGGTIPDEAQAGPERFRELVRARRTRSAEEIVEHVVREVSQFQGSEDFDDDLTLIVVKVTGEV